MAVAQRALSDRLLLSVHSATKDKAERAQVWVSDDYRPKFLERLEQFIAEVRGHCSTGPEDVALQA